jgi:hypothetical protein
MIDPATQWGWVPAAGPQHAVRVLRGWVIALAIAVGVGGVLIVVLIAALALRSFGATSFPVVESAPRDCRLSTDASTPRLYVALDATAVGGGYLTSASPINGWDKKIVAVGVVSTLAPLSTLDDAGFERIVEDAAEDPPSFGDEITNGVIVAIVDTEGETDGRLYGLETNWVNGEPAYVQDLPLGVDFSPQRCTVARVVEGR